MPFDVDLLARSMRLLAEPVPREKRRLLAARWRELDPALRTPVQGFGRQTAGCGATLGILPKCDFDCVGCYLGPEANRIPRLAHESVLARRLRRRFLRSSLEPPRARGSRRKRERLPSHSRTHGTRFRIARGRAAGRESGAVGRSDLG